MKTYFVTGTDTGCGKTTVSFALLAAATRRGLRTACMKPVESGCPGDAQGGLIPQDAERLRSACSLALPLELVCPYRYAPPIAPGIAALRTGRPIESQRIRRCLDEILVLRPDFVLVEGAGGLLVPLGPGALMRDLARELALPLIVVARTSLGTINHTLLTVEAATRGGLTVAAIILNDQQPDTDPIEVTASAREIAARCEAPILGPLPYFGASSGTHVGANVETNTEPHLDSSDAHDAGELAERHLALDSIL